MKSADGITITSPSHHINNDSTEIIKNNINSPTCYHHCDMFKTKDYLLHMFEGQMISVGQNYTLTYI